MQIIDPGIYRPIAAIALHKAVGFRGANPL